jgi:hypothetical protein
MVGVLAGVLVSAPAAAAQRDTRDNLAVVDAAATEEFLERANSVIEQVFSYSYEKLDKRDQLMADLTTEEFREEQDALFAQIEAEAPTRQLTVTCTVAESAAQWLTEDDADVLVFLDQKSVSGVDGQESAAGAMLLATFELSRGEWLLAAVDTFEDR